MWQRTNVFEQSPPEPVNERCRDIHLAPVVNVRVRTPLYLKPKGTCFSRQGSSIGLRCWRCQAKELLRARRQGCSDTRLRSRNSNSTPLMIGRCWGGGGNSSRKTQRNVIYVYSKGCSPRLGNGHIINRGASSKHHATLWSLGQASTRIDPGGCNGVSRNPGPGEQDNPTELSTATFNLRVVQMFLC